MILIAYDKDKKIVDYIGDYIELAWNPRFFDVGNFSLYMTTERYDPKWRYVSDVNAEHVAVIESAVHKSPYNGDFVTVSGRMAESVLNDYTIYPTVSITPGTDLFVQLQALFQRETGTAARIYKSGDFTSPQVTTQQTGGQLWSWLSELFVGLKLGSRMTLSGVDQTWQMYVSEGRRTDLIFSPELNTIREVTAQLIVGETYNYALVAGQGEGADRITATVDLSSGGQIKKLWVDANDIKQEAGQSLTAYKEALKRRGIEKLLEHKKKTKVEGRIIQIQYKYGEDYKLGDIVNVDVPKIGVYEAQIIGANIVTKAGAIETRIELGEV